MSGLPRVSIVTATRNRPHLLRQALLSIRRQTYADFEAVVVDDGSSPDVHEEYRAIWRELDGRFALHLASPPGGPGSDPGRGRNFGVRTSKGDLIAFLDHDDIWDRDDHLEVGVNAMIASGAGYFFSHVRFEPPFPGLMWAVSPDAFASCDRVSAGPLVYHVPVDEFLRHMRHSHIHPSHSIVRRDAFERAGGFIEGLKTADDVNFLLRIADIAPGIVYRPDASVAIRMPEGKSYSLSSSQLAQTLAENQAMIDVRSRCRSEGVRRCARSRQGWALRQLAAQVSSTSAREARRFAWEAFTVFPTLGALWFLVKACVGTISLGIPASRVGDADVARR